MKIRDDFFIRDIGEDSYLLPCGQAIATFCHGVKLQGAGRLLAERLMQDEGASEEELVSLLSDLYGDEVPLDELRKDVKEFTADLRTRGLLGNNNKYLVSYNSGDGRYFEIAGLTMKYTGPECLLFENLSAFECNEKQADIEVSVYNRSSLDLNLGRLIVRNRELLIYDSGDEFGIVYTENRFLRESVIRKDGTKARLYITSVDPEGAEEVFMGLRTAFLVLAQRRDLFAIHSVSALYDGGIVLFSGVSGAGKSTHSRLWEEHFGVDILNGDLNLIGRDVGGIMVYGLPWCGTSGIYRPFKEKLHGIFFITQSKENKVRELKGSERVLTMANRMISPSWTRGTVDLNIRFAEESESGLYLAQLMCRVDRDAAEVARTALDGFLN